MAVRVVPPAETATGAGNSGPSFPGQLSAAPSGATGASASTRLHQHLQEQVRRDVREAGQGFGQCRAVVGGQLDLPVAGRAPDQTPARENYTSPAQCGQMAAAVLMADRHRLPIPQPDQPPQSRGEGAAPDAAFRVACTSNEPAIYRVLVSWRS